MSPREQLLHPGLCYWCGANPADTAVPNTKQLSPCRTQDGAQKIHGLKEFSNSLFQVLATAVVLGTCFSNSHLYRQQKAKPGCTLQSNTGDCRHIIPHSPQPWKIRKSWKIRTLSLLFSHFHLCYNNSKPLC